MAYELFICVINRPEAVEDVIAGLLEIGVKGCTIIDTKGMGKIISQDIPIFSGFKNLFAGARESNVTIFSVMEAELVDSAIDIIEQIHQSFTEPSSGIAFSLPVSKVKGIATKG
ncbi:MAG: P-II family nitrogen regulator [Nitrospinota bacterium]|nr:P-II family nitrogen regulator [Nitrospinota bacterium]MDH4184259.1 P-II family nitrogen regulator [Nitrospinota bacterium]